MWLLAAYGQPTGVLIARAVWPGLRVGGRLMPFHTHYMNRVNSRSGLPWWHHRKHYHPYYCYYYYYCYWLGTACFHHAAAAKIDQEHYSWHVAVYKMCFDSLIRGASRICQRGWTMASTELEPITGVWSRSPQQSPGAEPLLGVSGAKPLLAESFLSIFIQKRGRKIRI